MNQDSSKQTLKLFLPFLTIWGILNLLQAGFTNLHYDEAYYWLWSKYPAWGYFDHPPMIAMMIKVGCGVFSNELGVRLLAVLSQIASLMLIWSLLNEDRKKKPLNVLLLILIIAALPVINVYGFIATPDSPVLFFSVLFLFYYKRFLKDESWPDTFMLGISMAGMAYSKYHGLLLIILVLVSNLKLLRSAKFWIASIFAVALFVPHILWQFNNDFPSLRFHLAERASGFELKNVPEYLANQLVIHNPFLFPLMLWLIFKRKTKDVFERSLKFIVAGFLIFFLASALRYHVEPQWTALITFPMIILFFNNTDFTSAISRYIRITAAIVIPLILLARLAIVIDFLPVPFLKKEFHDPVRWTKEIEHLAGSRPVAFSNSYHDASLYSFYTGNFVYSLDNKNYRKTQFDIWNFEEQLHGKEVFYKPHWLDEDLKKVLSFQAFPSGDTLYYRVFKDFRSLQKECIALADKSYSFTNSGVNEIMLKLYNPYPFQLNLDHPEFPVSLELIFFKNGNLADVKSIENKPPVMTINPGDTITFAARFHATDIPEGEYKFAAGSSAGILFDAVNSRFRKVIITR